MSAVLDGKRRMGDAGFAHYVLVALRCIHLGEAYR